MSEKSLSNLKYDTHGEITLAGSSNAYTGDTAEAVTGYYNGLLVCGEANHTNTGAATLNLNSIGAGDIKLTDGSDPSAGNIQNGGKYFFLHDGTNFQLLNPYIDTSIAAGSVGTTELADEAVTYAKMQHVSATSRVLGRKTAGAGDVEECTLSEVLDFIGSAAQGDILYRGSSSWARLGAGTSGQFLQTQGVGANPQWGSASWTYATLVNTTSGTAITLVSGLPSTVREIEIMIRGLSTNSNNVDPIIQLGDSGGFETTGYTCGFQVLGTFGTQTAGFQFSGGSAFDAATPLSGVIKLSCFNDDNTEWNAVGWTENSTNVCAYLSGHKTLSAAITQIQLTTTTGTPTFDAGSVSVRYR